MEGSYYEPVHADNMNHRELRLCTVRTKNEDGKDEERRAIFHEWSRWASVVDPSPMIGGHPGGTVAGTVAIVEYMNGQVDTAYPGQIRFLDTEEFIPTGKRRKNK